MFKKFQVGLNGLKGKERNNYDVLLQKSASCIAPKITKKPREEAELNA